MGEFASFFAEYQDYLAPRLDVYEQADYLYIARTPLQWESEKQQSALGLQEKRWLSVLER